MKKFGLPVNLATESVKPDPLLNTVKSQLQNTMHLDNMEILSPRLLSIVPENPKKRNPKIEEMLMSPTFLSFHEEGNYSIQSLLDASLSKIYYINDRSSGFEPSLGSDS